MQNYDDETLVNIGTGVDVTIKELAETIQETVGYDGKINWNTDKPDGTPKKLMDVSKLNGLGWKHSIELKEGIKLVYEDFKNNAVRKM